MLIDKKYVLGSDSGYNFVLIYVFYKLQISFFQILNLNKKKVYHKNALGQDTQWPEAAISD